MGTGFIITFLAFCFTFQTVYCIHCWSCNSEYDPKCADPFDNTTDSLFQCIDKVVKGVRLPAQFCRKIRQKVEGNWRTIRGCAYTGEVGEGTGNENVCLIAEGTHDVYSEYCTCDSKSGCNAGHSIVIHNPVIVFAITFIILLSQLLNSWRYT